MSPELPIFADRSMTFAYSTLVLQHIAPDLSKRYICELMRVLAPGGLLVFQLPSHRAAEEPAAGLSRTEMAGRLPAGAFRARLATAHSAFELRADEELTLQVTVENASSFAWAALPDPRGRYQLNVGNHWLTSEGASVQRDDGRCPLPHDVAPGSRADVLLGIKAPGVEGRYQLEVDMVQENVGWFAERGSETLRVPCDVAGGRAGLPPPAMSGSAAKPDLPFRTRHPRAFAFLKVTRLRDVYWAWRRGLDGVKARRDRGILRMRARFYDPVVPPLVNWWKGRPFAPRMEMHCVLRSEVLELIEANGGTAVQVDEELTRGGFQSCRYWVVKEGSC